MSAVRRLLAGKQGLVQVGATALREHLQETRQTIVGLDVGTRKVGVAVAEHVDSIALPMTVVWRGQQGCTLEVASFIRHIASSNHIGALVVGWPLELDGSEGVTCRKVARFMRRLDGDLQLTLPYALQDETNSTVDAYEYVKENFGLGYDGEVARGHMNDYFNSKPLGLTR